GFALAVTHHEPEVPELQKGPAADALVLAEPQLRHEITDGGFKVGNGQYVLGFDDAEGHVSLRVCRPSPWDGGDSILPCDPRQTMAWWLSPAWPPGSLRG